MFSLLHTADKIFFNYITMKTKVVLFILLILCVAFLCGCMDILETFGGWGPRGYLHRFRRRGRRRRRRRRRHGSFARAWALGWRLPWVSTWWNPPCNCKRGCTPNGCAFPGTGIDDCVWASDCNCCDYY